MKHNKIIPLSMTLLLALLCFTFMGQVQAQTDFDPAKLSAEDYVKVGAKDGQEFSDKKGDRYKVQMGTYSRGVLIAVKENGQTKWKRHGMYYNLRSDGSVSSQDMYQYGKREGEHKSFYPNGKVQFLYYYKNDMKNGKWYQYREDGSLVEELSYVNDKKHGECISYFNGEGSSTGPVQFTKNYVEGMRQGDTLQYNEKGKLISRSTYVDDKQVGKTIWYN